MTGRRVEAELTRPGLEGIEDHHRPVDSIAEALEAADEVEGEAVGRPRCDTDRVREAGFPERRHPVPDLLALVPGAVRVVEQQQVEAVLSEPLEAAFCRHPQIAGVLARRAQRGVGESREALWAGPLSLIEVVANGADQAELLACDALERASERANPPRPCRRRRR